MKKPRRAKRASEAPAGVGAAAARFRVERKDDGTARWRVAKRGTESECEAVFSATVEASGAARVIGFDGAVTRYRHRGGSVWSSVEESTEEAAPGAFARDEDAAADFDDAMVGAIERARALRATLLLAIDQAALAAHECRRELEVDPFVEIAGPVLDAVAHAMRHRAEPDATMRALGEVARDAVPRGATADSLWPPLEVPAHAALRPTEIYVREAAAATGDPMAAVAVRALVALTRALRGDVPNELENLERWIRRANTGHSDPIPLDRGERKELGSRLRALADRVVEALYAPTQTEEWPPKLVVRRLGRTEIARRILRERVSRLVHEGTRLRPDLRANHDPATANGEGIGSRLARVVDAAIRSINDAPKMHAEDAAEMVVRACMRALGMKKEEVRNLFEANRKDWDKRHKSRE